jgi:hypothetical protein
MSEAGRLMFYVNPDVRDPDTERWSVDHISTLILASRTYEPSAIGGVKAFWKR